MFVSGGEGFLCVTGIASYSGILLSRALLTSYVCTSASSPRRREVTYLDAIHKHQSSAAATAHGHSRSVQPCAVRTRKCGRASIRLNNWTAYHRGPLRCIWQRLSEKDGMVTREGRLRKARSSMSMYTLRHDGVDRLSFSKTQSSIGQTADVEGGEF